MAKVKKGDGSIGFGGKPLPPEGEQKYIFNGVAELCGKTNQMLRIEAEYAIDPDGTQPVTCLCWLADEKGLQSLMSIIVESKVYKKLMAKDKSLPNPEPDGWDDEQILLTPEFIEQLGIELVGCSAFITIEHFDNEWKDEEGNDRKSRKSRVVNIREYDGKSGKVENGTPPVGKTVDEWEGN